MLGQLDLEPEFIPGFPRMLCKDRQNQPRVGGKVRPVLQEAESDGEGA